MRYDLGIIGGGPAGYTAAAKAAARGLSVVLFEMDRLGGTCLNRGCIPTKSLLHSSKEYHKLSRLNKLGIKVGDCSFDYDLILARKTEVVTSLREGIAGMLRKVEVVKERARIINEHQINGYEVENILICTGSRVSKPAIKGIEYAITSDEILEQDHPLYDSLIIIGGGVIGVEIASIYLNLGRQVSILEMTERLLPGMDRELAVRLNMFLKKQGADIITNAAVKKIDSEHEVSYLDKNGREKSLKADMVLMATGRKANIEELFEEGFLAVDKGIVTDENYRSSKGNIYAVGDCRSGSVQLAHAASGQGENVIDVIMGRDKSVDDSLIPSCVYTSVEIASVGLSEKEAVNKGINVVCKKVVTGSNGKCLIQDSESGYVKLVVNSDNQQIIGAQLICPEATNLIAELAVIVQKKMSLKDLKQVVHPHPTIAEMIWEAAE